MASHASSFSQQSLVPQQRRSPWSLSDVLTSSLGTLFMTIFAVYFLLPLAWLFFSATKSNAELFGSNGLWFASQFALGDNLHLVFTRDGGIFFQWLLNSVLYSGGSALGAAGIATLAGFALAKYRFHGRELLIALILGSVMVPSAALVLPIFLLLSKLDLINTYWGVILPSLISPFGVYLMRVYTLGGVPDELLDAARLDGAGEFRVFWSIAFPALMPGFITVLLLSFVGVWNNFFLPLVVLNDSHLYPLTLGLATWQDIRGPEITYSLIITGALVTILPLIGAFLFLQRYWQSGLTVGSVRG
jgi:multiple sugar transport system permease protein